MTFGFEEQAGWLNEFLRMDLTKWEEMAPADRDRLIEQASAFYYGLPVEARYFLRHPDILILQTEVRTAFKRLADGELVRFDVRANHRLEIESESSRFILATRDPTLRLISHKDGLLRLLFVFGDKVRLCPTCKAPFFKFHKRQFCSASCSEKGRIARQWQRRHPGQVRRVRVQRSEETPMPVSPEERMLEVMMAGGGSLHHRVDHGRRVLTRSHD